MEILDARRKNFEEIAQKAAKSAKQGKVLVCPTDTVYGLVADAANKMAVAKIFKIKNRERIALPVRYKIDLLLQPFPYRMAYCRVMELRYKLTKRCHKHRVVLGVA